MITKIRKQKLIDIIRVIGDRIDILLDKSAKQNIYIEELQIQNANLQKINEKTIDEIKEYIKELAKIRKYYVENNNNTEQ